MHTYVCTYVYVFTYVHTYVRTYAYTIHMYIHMYIHMKRKNLKRKSAKSDPRRSENKRELLKASNETEKPQKKSWGFWRTVCGLADSMAARIRSILIR